MIIYRVKHKQKIKHYKIVNGRKRNKVQKFTIESTVYKRKKIGSFQWFAVVVRGDNSDLKCTISF